MTYQVALPVVVSGSNELPDELAAYADSHGITYEQPNGGDHPAVVFQADNREALEDMIKYAYAPDKESEHGQLFAGIQESSNTDQPQTQTYQDQVGDDDEPVKENHLEDPEANQDSDDASHLEQK